MKIVTALCIFALCMLVFSPVSDAFEPIPDRKAWNQGGFLGQMIDEHMERARLMRQTYPDLIYVVQVWADMDTGVWNMNLTIGKEVRMKDKTTYVFVMLVPGNPTPIEYKQKTGKECLMSYFLQQYEWFHGRQGDI